MAYNNYFPTNYYPFPQQTFYQPQIQQPQMQTPLNAQQIIWVNNEAEAQAYPVAPNNAVALWDSQKAAIYLKQADATGKPTFKAYDLVEHVNVEAVQDPKPIETPISKEDLDNVKALQGKIDELIGVIKLDMDSRKKPTKKKENEDE